MWPRAARSTRQGPSAETPSPSRRGSQPSGIFMRTATSTGASNDMARAIREAVHVSGGKGSFVQVGSMFKYFFRENPPRNYREAKESDTGAFARFWKEMLSRGIFLPPSQFETNFLSAAHTDEDIEAIARGYQECLS